MVSRLPYWSGFGARARAALGALGTSTWWTEALEAWWRQWLQAALPWLLLVAATGAVTRDGLLTVAWAAGSGLVTVVLARVTGLKPDPAVPGAVQRTYRALSAAAASLLTAWPATATGLLVVDWHAVAAAAVASAAASLVHGVLDPPATVAEWTTPEDYRPAQAS
jgi:hypothetical protein